MNYNFSTLLCKDTLYIILGNLLLIDLARSVCVCRLWYSVVVDKDIQIKALFLLGNSGVLETLPLLASGKTIRLPNFPFRIACHVGTLLPTSLSNIMFSGHRGLYSKKDFLRQRLGLKKAEWDLGKKRDKSEGGRARDFGIQLG
ncbi:F-box At1g55000 [Olea europaea subsp. europaea]|uniref:F-box At1g55000 n=1 Tax=Olea europaea subsp. europaea TaxID=158383 RepID=A0A8S0QBN2_OLEEU|nr:F-box At1g55000 [Olea europaea subsp. europaea]